MPYPIAAVGRQTAPLTHDVDARWLLAYASVLGESDPRLCDTRVDGGIVAHPLFPVCLEWPAVLALRELTDRSELAASELARGVHATHDLVLHRPIRPGDALRTTATIVGAERRSPGTYETVRLETVDEQGLAVASTWMGSLFLGVDLDGDDVPVADPPPPLPATDRSGTPITDGTTIVRSLPGNLGHTYTECARIWNPIHTDTAFAEAAGLPGIILHGTATLATAVSEAWPRLRGEEKCGPGDVGRIHARFTGMVQVPADLTIGLRVGDGAADGTVTGEVRGEHGTVVRDLVVVAR